MMGVHDMMRNTAKLCIITIFVMAMTALFSCSEDAPPAHQPQVVKKKIGGQQKSNVKPAQAVALPLGAKAEGSAVSKDTPAMETEAKTPTSSKLVEESMAFAGGYNPKGRFDPFEPLFKSETDQKTASAKSGRKKRGRIPQTPLERVALSQLKLSAIMRTTKGNSAIVEDATGKGYVIRKGTYIGLNSGQVVKIEKDRVMIEEETEDISGEFRIQNTELKLQKPAGEL
jgi:type IV pilus assembly protein PilP